MEIIRDFHNINKNDISLAGGKGATLGEMTQTGISVPPGFVILSTAYEKFLEGTDLNIEIDAVLDSINYKEIHTVENASEKIKALILNVEMPKDIREEIQKFFKNLNSEYVAVRSSATAEDSASAAWAGQLESFLNTTEETLLENVKKCWASLFTPRAIFYRFEKDLHKQKISVGVVVQKMIESEVSGIAFSVHPVTEDKNQLIIEAGLGLGEAIVSGQITPDSYVVEKEPRRIIDRNVEVQKRGLYRANKKGNEWREIPKEQGEKQILSDKEILELSNLVLFIENHYNFPCDIEWVFEKGKFYIVQSRPITTLKRKADILDESWQKIWTTEYSLFSVWLFGKNFTDICFKEVGAGFSNVIFSIVGDLATLFRLDHEQKAFSKHFAKRMLAEQGFKEKVRKIVTSGQKTFLGFEKMKAKDFLTVKNLTKFIERHNKFIPYYLGNLWCPNEFASLETNEKNRNSTLAFCQKLRKETETILPDLEKFLQKAFDFIAKQKKINKKLLRSILPDELVEYAQSGKLPNTSVIKNRYANAVVWGKTIGIELLTGNQATDLINKIYKVQTDLRKIWGVIAQKGFHKGTVKIMLSKKDMSKIKEGDVIVTTMTRPEWVPAMKIAGAYVTDAGSVLCHAAIVARELNKPCVISTKIATQVLKDGNIVEVNANIGVVRIIK